MTTPRNQLSARSATQADADAWLIVTSNIFRQLHNEIDDYGIKMSLETCHIVMIHCVSTGGWNEHHYEKSLEQNYLQKITLAYLIFLPNLLKFDRQH